MGGGPVVNPKLSTIADLFGGSALNTTLWNDTSGAPDVTLDTSLDRVQILCQSYYPSLAADGPYDATDSSLFARVSPAPIGAGTTQTIMRIAVDSSNRVTYYCDGGGILTARVTNAGVNTDVVIGTYDAYSHAWWRLREAGGTIFFDTAPDGWTWTQRASIAHAWDATAVQVVFLCGYYGTETSGMAGYVDHVNTTNSAPGQPNLNWPLMEDAWAPYWNANAGTQPLDRYVEVTDRTRGSMSISRGRQYELDQVRSGEASLTLANTDATLDPVNTAGPWYGHIQPYQPYRKRAQWPPTRNLLDQHMATGGDLGGYPLGVIPAGSGGADMFSVTDTTGGSFVASSTAWQGTTVMQFAVPSGSTALSRVCHTPRWSPIPGQTYTMQIRVRNVTASTTLNVQPHIGWYTPGSGSPTSFNYGTSSTLTGSTTAGWTTLTVTATAPANSAGMDVGVALAAGASATCSLQVDGWQLEKGTTATTWQAPGVWFPMYAGWTERWSPTWDMAGTYGLVQPSMVDTFSLLSQQQLDDPLTQEINSHSPRFLYKLDDPSGSITAADWTGQNPPAQLGISKYGAGSWVFGSEITSTDAGGVYTGSGGTVATVNNANPGTNTYSAATLLQLTSAGITGPANPALWVRMIAFRYTGPTPTTVSVIWSCVDRRGNQTPSGAHIFALLDSAGKPRVWVQGPAGGGTSYLCGGATNCADGDWHLLIFGYNETNQQIMASQDGSLAAFYSGISTTMTPTGLISDNIGAYVDPTLHNSTFQTYQGDLSFVCEFGQWFDSFAISNLYSAWKSSCAGESTTDRYQRLLRYAGYSGVTSLDTGLTTAMGPAAIDGQDAMTALQAVVDTENGAHYVNTAGALVFKSRSARYNALTPMYTFGEDFDAGEWPYEDCQLDFDSTHLSNQVTVTQEATSQNFYATDDASVTAYFPRTMTRTINASSTTECQDAANYLLSRYRQPAQRVSSIKLHPSANPALWAVCLSLELGTRVRVMRRPPNVPAIEVDCFVENIQWDLDDQGEAWCTLQCSPADLTPYGVFGAWHTTLSAGASSGATSITIHASADNTNALAAQIAPGQQLVLAPGSASQETVTVKSVSATSSGWRTATITFTAVTTHAHSTNDVVCEPLPSGVTDSTTWDSVDQFDSIAFAY